MGQWLALERAFQVPSRLLAIPILLTGIASFFAFFNGLRFAALLCLISMLRGYYLVTFISFQEPARIVKLIPSMPSLIFLGQLEVSYLSFSSRNGTCFDYLQFLSSYKKIQLLRIAGILYILTNHYFSSCSFEKICYLFRLDLLKTPVIFENALLAKCSTLPSTFWMGFGR